MIADELVAYVADQLEHLERTVMPGWRIPRVYGGHAVGPDVRADLAFTLGHLHAAGVGEIAGTSLVDAVRRALRAIDGPATNTFYSYRVAETLLRFGSFEGNPVHEGWSQDERANLAQACDSTEVIPALEAGRLPPNYNAVLARCEAARLALGLVDDDAGVVSLTRRTAGVLAENPHGYLDDSNVRAGRYDIYTPDVYLFCEPFADRLGDVWTRGARSAVDLVGRVAATNGAAITWGRSSGALAVCLTIEVGGLALRHRLAGDLPRWAALGAHAFDRVREWFSDGVINAHRYRSPYRYRGPARRLQMTLDCLGKLADAALAYRDGGDVEPGGVVFPERDELVRFEDARPAGVWAYRSRDTAFVLPLVGGAASDYLPAPRNPGLFEVPVDSPQVVGAPYVIRSGRRYTTAGVPSSAAWSPGELVLRYDGLSESGGLEPPGETLGGSRDVTIRADRRTIRVREHLRFDEVPQAIALQVAETAGRPLRFEVHAQDALTTVVDTAGMTEWRSFWAELTRVHQVDLEPAREVSFAWSMTPMLRVATEQRRHHYHRALYDPLADRVVEASIPRAVAADLLATQDQFHLHWPEWFLGPELSRHEAFVAALRRAGVRVVWTQHNLAPHAGGDWHPIYQTWAGAADAVLHHSEWGRARVCERYRFRDDAVHAVVPHPHFGHLMKDMLSRPDAEAALGLKPCALRLGVIGAPRPGKDVQMVMTAVAACARDDVQLLVCSLRGDERVPDDARIVAMPYEYVAREVYDARLAAVDALVLPFSSDDMLTSGVVGDVVGLGVPALTSSWPYLAEVLGDAAIPYGDDLTARIESLDETTVGRAAAASRALRGRYSREAVSEMLFTVLEEVGTSKL